MQIVSIIAGMIATAFNMTGTTYATLYLDVHAVTVQHENKYVKGPFTVATAINETFVKTFNKKFVWGDADNAAPWTTMLSTLTPAVVTDTVSGTYNETLPAGKYLYMNYDINGYDGDHMITKTVTGIDESGDVPTIINIVSIIRRQGYIRTATFVNFSTTD